MKNVFVDLIYIILFFTLAACEHAIGVPLFTSTCAAIAISSTSHWKIPLLVVLSAVISWMYVLPFALVLSIFLFLSLNLAYSGQIIFHQSTRFFLAVLAANFLIGWWLKIPIDVFQVLYDFFSSALLLFFIRYWLYHRQAHKLLQPSSIRLGLIHK